MHSEEGATSGNPFILPSSKSISGAEFILAVEDAQSRLMARTLQINPFWRALTERPRETPEAVYYGLCVENYHLLFRESYFDAPILNFATNTKVRGLINEFYCEEYGHDRILLRALNFLGLSEEELFRSRPLRGTMALCNALSYWARHDPIFFLTTLGPLEGGDSEVDTYVEACRSKGLAEAFVGPIAAHARINREGDHGILTRKLFASIPVVSAQDAVRVLKQTRTFIQLYDAFYGDIWRHYQAAPGLLRLVEDI